MESNLLLKTYFNENNETCSLIQSSNGRYFITSKLGTAINGDFSQRMYDRKLFKDNRPYQICPPIILEIAKNFIGDFPGIVVLNNSVGMVMMKKEDTIESAKYFNFIDIKNREQIDKYSENYENYDVFLLLDKADDSNSNEFLTANRQIKKYILYHIAEELGNIINIAKDVHNRIIYCYNDIIIENHKKIENFRFRTREEIDEYNKSKGIAFDILSKREKILSYERDLLDIFRALDIENKYKNIEP